MDEETTQVKKINKKASCSINPPLFLKKKKQ